MKDRIVTEEKESSVDFLIKVITLDKLIRALTPVEWNRVFEKAKQLHREEIEESFTSGEHQQGFEGEAEQYYNENYKQYSSPDYTIQLNNINI